MDNSEQMRLEEIELDFQKNSDGLVPVIVQDWQSLKVLMLGYMNRDAYRKTLETGRVTFWSRTRKTLWTKGETSGNFLFVKEIFGDCDNDTLLIKAQPVGPTCHTGNISCFRTPDNEGFIRQLAGLVRERHEQMPEGSYTTSLFNKGARKISQKVGEEAVETVIEAVAGNRERFICEASDLLYHMLVLMEHMGCSIEDIENELVIRHKPGYVHVKGL